MEITLLLTTGAAHNRFTEWGFIQTKDLHFHPEIRQICEGNSCRGYGKTWACPPAVGTLDECKQKVLRYTNMFLLSQKFDLEDSFDFESMENGMKTFKLTVDRFAESVKQQAIDVLILSNEGCGRCIVCTYPDNPCRFPNKLYPSIEGFGFIVSELAQLAGIKYNNGPNTVTFFGAALFN